MSDPSIVESVPGGWGGVAAGVITILGGIAAGLRNMRRDRSSDHVADKKDGAEVGIISRLERRLDDSEKRADAAEARAEVAIEAADRRTQAAVERRDKVLEENARLVARVGQLERDIQYAEGKAERAMRVLSDDQRRLVDTGMAPLDSKL